MHAFVQSAQQWKLRTPLPKALRSWNAEGWYIVVEDSRLISFSTEYGTAPPEEVTSLFQDLESVPAKERLFVQRDVCLGFCYDPLAGLGFSIWPQRARLVNQNPDGG